MALFVPGSLRGRIAKPFIAARLFPGATLNLDDDGLTALEAAMATVLGKEQVRLAFFVLDRRLYRRVTALIMAPDGRTLAYAKLAHHDAEQHALIQEGNALAQLAAAPVLEGHVPSVLGSTTLETCRILLISPGPTGRGPNRLQRVHGEFLRNLQDIADSFGPFENSAAWHRMTTLAESLEGAIGESWSQRYKRAFDRLHAGLGPVALPLAFGHRDFCHWNTRMGKRGLFVFDWEAAVPAVTPLHDAFHFGAIPAVGAGRRYVPDRAIIRHILKRLWPAGLPYLALLYLAYLIDMSLFRAEDFVRAPSIVDTRILEWYGRAIDAWLEDEHAFVADEP